MRSWDWVLAYPLILQNGGVIQRSQLAKFDEFLVSQLQTDGFTLSCNLGCTRTLLYSNSMVMVLNKTIKLILRIHF